MSGVFKTICDTLGISQIRTSLYHPQSDGALERWHACHLLYAGKVQGPAKAPK